MSKLFMIFTFFYYQLLRLVAVLVFSIHPTHIYFMGKRYSALAWYFKSIRIRLKPSSHDFLQLQQIVISNHRSFVDIGMAFLIYPTTPLFVAKKQLKSKLNSYGLWGMLYYIDRFKFSHNQLRDLAARFKSSNRYLVIYPEGTRDARNDFLFRKLKSGFLSLARKVSSPISILFLADSHLPLFSSKPYHIYLGDSFIAPHLDTITAEDVLKEVHYLKKQYHIH